MYSTGDRETSTINFQWIFDTYFHQSSREENVTIFKLQPLDVACFSHLRENGKKTLNDWINIWEPRETIKKATFVNKLGDISVVDLEYSVTSC